MRLRTQLTAAVSIGMVLVLILALATFAVAVRMNKLSDEQDGTLAVRDRAFNLLALTQEFTAHSEARAQRQWKTNHAALLQLLDEAADKRTPIVPVPAELLAQARSLGAIFQQMVAAKANPIDFRDRQVELLVGQLTADVQSVSESSAQWTGALAAAHQQTQHEYYLWALSVPLLMLIMLSLIAALLMARVLRPLSTLQRAVHAVAQGDISIRCATGTNDEFGQLSHDFDAMAVDLVAKLRYEIADREQAEQALVRSDRLLRDFQKAANIGSYVNDLDAGTFACTSTLDDIFGITKDYPHTNEGWVNFMHPDFMQATHDALLESIEHRKPFDAEYKIIRPSDGIERWMHGLGQITYDDTGTAVSLIGTVQDITERKAAREAQRIAATEDTVEPLKRAELAMYEAKSHGRNTLRFFDPRMQAVVNTRVALESRLREAIAARQFLLHYQPQVTDKDQITGVEALLRWPDPKRGMVSPSEFIPLAEETGLILPIGNWVLETACRQLALWANEPALAQLTVAVNVSLRQFHERDFVDQVLSTVARTGANPSRLKIELTESLLVTDLEGVIEKMNALKGKGVTFSLDDFGTGYSSLSYLKRLPLDQLKIDQGFVRDILIDRDDAAIARMVTVLAASMGLEVIAEGVETQAQRDFLDALGCHHYQGYLFSRPLPIQEFETLLKRT